MHRYLLALTFIALATVPRVIETQNQSRQRRTMADLRSISMAWEARATKTSSYDVAATPTCTVTATAESFGRLCSVTAEQLAGALEPTYIRHMPRTDGWGNPLEFRVANPDAKGYAQAYAIRSQGSDHRADGQSYVYGSFTGFEHDLIYTNGTFLTFPGVS